MKDQVTVQLKQSLERIEINEFNNNQLLAKKEELKIKKEGDREFGKLMIQEAEVSIIKEI